MRKLLFLVFTDESCRQTHALMYALDLHRRGYQVRVVLEGVATKVMHELEVDQSRIGSMLRDAREAGILAGACKRASGGCACDDPARNVVDLAREHHIALLDDLDGHAGIEPFVREGYEVIVF